MSKITPKTQYFTKETEDAIVAFNASTNDRERNRIFNEHIYEPLCLIAENVFYSFKFPYQETSNEDVQAEVVSHMALNISKYKPENGKAFSYFSIVAKNWFIFENNKNRKRFASNVRIVDEPEYDQNDKASTDSIFLIEPDHQKENTKSKDLFTDVLKYWDSSITTTFQLHRDRLIATALLSVLSSYDTLDVTNRKSIYLYVKELTQCKDHHLSKVVKKMKEIYHTTKPHLQQSTVWPLKPSTVPSSATAPVM